MFLSIAGHIAPERRLSELGHRKKPLLSALVFSGRRARCLWEGNSGSPRGRIRRIRDEARRLFNKRHCLPVAERCITRVAAELLTVLKYLTHLSSCLLLIISSARLTSTPATFFQHVSHARILYLHLHRLGLPEARILHLDLHGLGLPDAWIFYLDLHRLSAAHCCLKINGSPRAPERSP